MILTADYHTHTPYSHGKNTVFENASRAKELGLKEVGISDHGFSHIAFGIRRKEFPAFQAECRQAEKELGIRVRVGIEANILGEKGTSDLTEKDFDDFDLYIAGKHIFVKHESLSAWGRYFAGNWLCDVFHFKPTKKLIECTTRAYINAIKKNPLDILSHINYDCFADAVEVAKCAADYGTYIEINTKKTHLTDEEWQNVIDKTSCRFVIDSDAHTASRVGDTLLADELFSRISFPMDRIDNIDGRLPVFRLEEYKKRR